MLKSKLFKSLVVAGLITAISVPVFAAGQTEQVQPTMRDKVEKIPMHAARCLCAAALRLPPNSAPSVMLQGWHGWK